MIRNFSIVHFDHAQIFLHTDSPLVNKTRPYQIENWCLSHPAVRTKIEDVWKWKLLARQCISCIGNLCPFGNVLNVGVLIKKTFWGVNWKSIFSQLQAQSTNIKAISQGATILGARRL